MASAESQVLSWYAGLEPLTVDVIGEFAGRELFVVHGEALIRHCLEQSRVDYDGAFAISHDSSLLATLAVPLSQSIMSCHVANLFHRRRLPTATCCLCCREVPERDAQERLQF